MIAKELRIGNLLFFKSDISGQEKILEVDWVFFSEDFWLRNSRPIPITEELLLKFGFVKYTHSLFEHPSFDGQRQMKYSMTDGFALQTIRGGFVWYLPSIKYVHQIQNLYFALTGKEL